MNAAVDPSNKEQLDLWDGERGAFWTKRADRINDGVARYRDHLLDAATITDTDTILDIGCGSGETTRDAARRAPAGTALGVDLSAQLLDLARTHTAEQHLTNVHFEQADAQIHPFPDDHFDIAISRHGTMFFGDPTAAFTNIARALRPGGRLTMLTWQSADTNEWTRAFRAAAGTTTAPKTPGPASLSDPDLIHNLLTTAGFTDIQLTSLTEPMYFGTDADDATAFIAEQFGLTHDDQVNALRASMADHQTDQGVFYDSATWLIQASTSAVAGHSTS